MTYKEHLSLSMSRLSNDPSTVFVGQQIVFAGNPMSTTLNVVPKEKMIELPVMEETQMGFSLGLAMAGKQVVTFYPRWDFLLLATNQLVNHVDKYFLMTGKKLNMIIRVGKGSDYPLDPGYQHKGDYLNEFTSLCKHIRFHNLEQTLDIEPAYNLAHTEGGVHVIVEYPQKYHS